MSDSTRKHLRVPEHSIGNKRVALSRGNLLLPEVSRAKSEFLILHCHGAPWLAEWSARRRWPRAAVVTLNIGAGSAVYRDAFADPAVFRNLCEEAGTAAGIPTRPVVLTAFSAGYGAIREILRVRDNWARLTGVLLMDSMHAAYAVPDATKAVASADVEPFVDFAREAVASRKYFVITHSEVYPGTYASTTETADFLLMSLGLRRRAVLRWGPVGMQQVSEAGKGRLTVLGFAGNSAPDHVDHFHAMQTWLRRIR